MKRRMVCRAQGCATRGLEVDIDPAVETCIACGATLNRADVPDFAKLFGRDPSTIFRDIFGGAS